MTVTSYWPLLLLATIPFLWWVRGNSRTDLSAKHLRLATTVRSLAIVFLVGALMQPVLTRTGNWLSVVYLLDVSDSVSPQQIGAAVDWIEESDRLGQPDHVSYIPFAANALVLDDVESLRKVPVGDVEAPGTVDQRATNIEGAMELASGAFAPEHLKHLVLLSDGNENAGAVRSALSGLALQNVSVYTHPLDVRRGPDAWIEDMKAPRMVTEDELFPVEVHVYSQLATSARITIQDLNGQEIHETRTVDLTPGLNRFAFELQTLSSGSLMLEGLLESEEDRFPANNVFRQSLAVRGPPRVLYVEGRPESSVYLQTALELESIEVDVVGPSDIPDRTDAFDAYDALILSDVRADAMSEDQMEAIATYVGDLGGGLILIGGESVFGENGYSDTRLEDILPIRFDLEREPPTVALVIVLDKSGSMGGQKLELVKEASKAAVEVLRDEQLIGMVAFDYNHYWPFRLQPAANRTAIDESISTIVAGGETNIYPALREAHQALLTADAEIKHVILLSDGRSLPDDFQALVKEMVASGETVSTVAVGNGADRELLSDIAEWGDGRDYFIEDAKRVPQVFTEETELATQGTLREDPFRPVVLKEVEALRGIDFSEAPLLLGYVATLARDTSEVLLTSDASEDAKPILARWQFGLGKAVAFTSDAKDRWAADWLNWDGYTRFWPQLVRETMRPQDRGELDIEIQRKGTQAKVQITALDRNAGYQSGLSPDVRVIDPSLDTVELKPVQTGPGTYEARFKIEDDGPYVVNVAAGEFRASRTLPYSYPEEYHLYPPDTDLLAGISQASGGVFDPAQAEIFDTGTNTVLRSWSLWPLLTAAALLLYLTDLLLRRVRLFDRPATPVENPSPSAS